MASRRTTQAIYYRGSDGSEPVREYRNSLADTPRAALDFHISLLSGKSEGAPPPNFPTTSQVRGPLRELRCASGGQQHRVLYRRSRNFIVLLHAFRKNTPALDDADIRLAEERFEDFQRRIDAVPRVPPRPLGQDAP